MIYTCTQWTAEYSCNTGFWGVQELLWSFKGPKATARGSYWGKFDDEFGNWRILILSSQDWWKFSFVPPLLILKISSLLNCIILHLHGLVLLVICQFLPLFVSLKTSSLTTCLQFRFCGSHYQAHYLSSINKDISSYYCGQSQSSSWFWEEDGLHLFAS